MSLASVRRAAEAPPNCRRPRVCVCTSYPADREPRAPRHAAALAELGCEVIFVDSAPRGEMPTSIESLRSHPEIEQRTFRIPHRRNGFAPLLVRRGCGRLAQMAFRSVGTVSNAALNASLVGMESLLQSARADIYFAHNIDMLWPAWKVARSRNASLLFDSMEYHADMGNAQTRLERDLIDRIQRRCLPECRLITASSHEVASALSADYALRNILPLQNVPRITSALSPKQPGFNLYWRNAVVNFGERGLLDILLAMPQLPTEIHLHLQGRQPLDGGAAVRAQIERLGLTGRVTFHPPYLPDDAVAQASRFQIGLCLERRGNRNHDLTTSNKLFDYHMAGLAVVCSDLPGLASAVARSGGGMTFQAGDVDSLRAAVRRLYDQPELLARYADAARRYAFNEGHLEHEMETFKSAFSQRFFSERQHVGCKAMTRVVVA